MLPLPPRKSVVIALGGPPPAGGPSMPPPDDADGASIPLTGSEYPTLFLPKVDGLPDFLTEGYEGDIEFHVRVTDSDDAGVSFELMSMSPDAPMPQKPDPTAGRAAMDDNWNQAEQAGQ